MGPSISGAPYTDSQPTCYPYSRDRTVTNRRKTPQLSPPLQLFSQPTAVLSAHLPLSRHVTSRARNICVFMGMPPAHLVPFSTRPSHQKQKTVSEIALSNLLLTTKTSLYSHSAFPFHIVGPVSNFRPSFQKLAGHHLSQSSRVKQ